MIGNKLRIQNEIVSDAHVVVSFLFEENAVFARVVSERFDGVARNKGRRLLDEFGFYLYAVGSGYCD